MANAAESVRDMRASNADVMVEAIQAVTPELQKHALQEERNGRLSDETVRRLAEIGVFDVSVPREYGGLAFTVAEQRRVYTACGSIAGSTGWISWVTTTHDRWIALFSKRAQDEFFGLDWMGPRACGVVTANGPGTARKVEGGYQLEGTWPYCSGSRHAAWAVLGAMTDVGAGPAGMLFMLVPLEDFEVLDDWAVSGMKATGSNTVRTKKPIFVPEHRTVRAIDAFFNKSEGPPPEGLLYRNNFTTYTSLLSGSTPLGIAKAALAYFVGRMHKRAITATDYKVQADAPVTHHQLAEVTHRIDGAERLLDADAEEIDRRAAANVPFDMLFHVKVRYDVAASVRACAEAVEILHRAGGASTISLETEALRRLPDATIQDAIDAGILSLGLPRSLGGSGGGLREMVQAARIMGRGHLSAAWTLTFFMVHNHMLARFPIEAQKVVFPEGRFTLASGLINTPRMAVAVDGGYRVTGRWPYATGISHAQWALVFAVVANAKPAPRPMLFIAPKKDFKVEDTWRMSGVQGTGSHDIILENLFVPEHLALDYEVWASRRNPGSGIHPETVYSYSIFDALAFVFPAMALGAAEAVLSEFKTAIEGRCVPFSDQKIADSVPGQIRYARALSALQTAEALLERSLDETIAENARSPDEFSTALRGRLTLNLLSLIRMANECADLCARGAGSGIFKSDHPMQHFLRDLQIVSSHKAFDEDAVLSKTGAVLLDRGGAFSGGEIIRQ